jgi:hypothetical protein
MFLPFIIIEVFLYIPVFLEQSSNLGSKLAISVPFTIASNLNADDDGILAFEGVAPCNCPDIIFI